MHALWRWGSGADEQWSLSVTVGTLYKDADDDEGSENIGEKNEFAFFQF